MTQRKIYVVHQPLATNKPSIASSTYGKKQVIVHTEHEYISWHLYYFEDVKLNARIFFMMAFVWLNRYCIFELYGFALKNNEEKVRSQFNFIEIA